MMNAIKYLGVAGIILAQFSGFTQFTQTKSSTSVPDYGIIWNLNDVVKPNTELDYKIVIYLKSPIGNPGQLNPGLNNVARMLNLHATGLELLGQIKESGVDLYVCGQSLIARGYN